MEYKFLWTEEAINNLEDILDYLEKNWSQKEIEDFKIKLSKQLVLIPKFPHMFPVSLQNQKLRKAVLSKQTTLYYQIKGNLIYLVTLFVNVKDIGKLDKL